MEYRSPAKSRTFVATYAAPSGFSCTRKAAARAYRRVLHHPVSARLIAGLPPSVTRALGRRVSGYGLTITDRVERFDLLVFAYEDIHDPHVVYNVAATEVNHAPTRSVLRLVHATG